MSWLGEARMYWRFSMGLRRFLRHEMSLDEARGLVRLRLEQRTETFLRIAERSIYGYPGSPYRALLLHAGVTPADLRALTGERGLEGGLLELRRLGVYVAFDEFKGRRPIARPGLELPVKPHSFDNPFLVTHFVAESGGSTGVPMRVPHDLDQYAALSPSTLMSRAAFGVHDAPLAIWRGILPMGSGINNVLFAAYYGRPPERWFTPVKAFEARNHKFTLATYYFCALARIYGAAVPFPEHVPADRAIVVARWAADAVQRSGQSVVSATVSSSLRVALAARENGFDLRGVTFLSGGEPLTEEKVRGIELSGARIIPQYSMSEAGRVGNGCAHPVDGTDVHLAKDCFALVTFPRAVPGFDLEVDAFHLTALLTSAPKILLNVEMDDFGVVEERSCGCLWDRLGFTTHLRGIRSYRKLTGEGVTLIAGDMIRILEHELPARYGGTPLDYQLLEEQDERGFTRLNLIISPRVPIADEHAVVDTVSRLLRETSAMADAARSVWGAAGTLRVKRREPLLSGHGKFSPLYVLRNGQRL